MSVRYLEVEGASPGEYYFLILCSTLGMMIMAGGIDLITSFIGLETMAVSFYILAGFIKPNQRSNEAAVKYFLLGAFSLGILLYGMSLLYGLSGTTNLRVMATVVRRAASAIRCWCWRSSWSSPAWASRSPRCRSTCGRPTSTRARRRRSPRSCRSARRRPRSRCCCGSSVEGLPSIERRLAAAVRGARHRHDDGRQPRGADAVEHQADAGLFVDRARRLPADGRRRRARRAASRRC